MVVVSIAVVVVVVVANIVVVAEQRVVRVYYTHSCWCFFLCGNIMFSIEW